MNNWLFGVVAAFSILATSTASSAVLDYNETIDGDLSNSILSPTVFTLDMAGMNTVRARTTNYFNTSPFDIDAFQVDLAPGIAISSITINVFGIVTVGSDLTISTSYLATSVPTNSTLLQTSYGLGLDPIAGNNTAIGPFTDSVLLRTSAFGIGSSDGLEDGQGAVFNYRWTIVTTGSSTAPVPLPSSALLLLVGIGGLATTRVLRSVQRYVLP